MTRNLVVCLDGTSNEPEHGSTNVVRLYEIARKSDDQLVYYDPGVGTMGARAAVTQIGKALTRGAGMVAGFGVRENIEEAYTWLSRNYQPGDQLYVFGFSRGAYTARALTGMLRTVGLLRPGADNLVPYAVKLYAQSGNSPAKPGTVRDPKTEAAEDEFWRVRREFRNKFGHPEFPDPFNTKQHQVRFLGVWDTVKSVGWLNLKARIEMARWPFTRKITNVQTARHALAIDERRRPFWEYRFDAGAVADANGRYQEIWFAGVHSDVGGQFPDDHDLSDIALSWMVKEAAENDFLVDERRYKSLLKSAFQDELPPDRAMGRIHTNERVWWLAGGWHKRQVRPGDALHFSVQQRIEQSAAAGKPWRPDLKR